MNKTILAIAAHSDDEALGCAGTLARHSAQRDNVHIIFMTNGVGARQSVNPDDEVKRNSSAENAAKLLKARSVSYLSFPDNAMDSVSLLSITQELETLISRIQPEVIYTHHHGDLNIDHRLTQQAVLTACRPLPESSIKEIYAFEVLSSTEWQQPGVNAFTPDVFVDISEHIKDKMNVIEQYSDEMRESPHSRSKENVKALALYRGHCSGVQYAEAFKLIRLIR